MKILCIDIGGTYIKYTRLDERLILESVKRVDTPQDGLETFFRQIEDIYRECSDVDGIAISTPGILDPRTGFMKNGGSIDYIKNLPLAEIVSARCGGLPVAVENDAKAAAAAELETGVLKGCRNAVVLTIGTAIGGTIIADGKILRGRNMFAGELSYACYLPDDTAQIAEPRFWGRYGVPSRICEEYAREGVNSEEIINRMKRGDVEAKRAVCAAANELALLIHNLQCVIDPETVAIGGGISAQDAFIKLVREASLGINASIGHGVPLPNIECCKYHNNANLIGVYYVFRNMTGGRTNVGNS